MAKKIKNDMTYEELATSDQYLKKREIYNTGYRNVDTLISCARYDPNTGEMIRRNGGILSGSVVGFVGKSGSGKSTLATQMLANTMRKFIKKDIPVKLFIIDIENGMPVHRFANITNFTQEEIDKYVVWTSINDTDDLKELTAKIIMSKEDEKKMKVTSYLNNEEEIHIPTFILVDAISELLPDLYADVDSEDSNMMAAKTAQELMKYFQKYKSQFVRSNINLYYVAHVGTKANFDGGFNAPPARDFKGMSNKEKVNGGKALQYATDIGFNLERIVLATPKALEDKSLGYLEANDVLQCKLWKNRQGREGDEFYLVRDKFGFSPIKSFIYECVAFKIIESSGSNRKMKNWEDKFRGKDIIDKMVIDKDFRGCLFKNYDEEKKSILEANKKTNEDRESALAELDLFFDEE